MNDEFNNPFASPEHPTSTVLVDTNRYDDSEKIHFSGNLEPEDLKHVFQHSKKTVAHLFWLIAAFIAVALLINRASFYIAILVVILAYLFMLWKNRQASNFENIAKSMPALFGPVKGFVSPYRICFQHDSWTTEYLLSSQTQLSFSDDRIVAFFSVHRVTPSVLPKRFFSGEAAFVRASNIMQERYEQLSDVQIAVVDKRIVETEPSYPIADVPENGIPYYGKVTMRDAIESKSFKDKRLKYIQSHATVLLFVSALMYFVGWSLTSHVFAAFLSGVTTLLLGVLFAKTMRGIWKLDQALVNSKGWISDAGIETGISFGRSFYSWKALSQLEVTDVAFIVQLSGLPGLHLVHSITQFDGHEAWQSAIEVARRNCPDSSK